MNSSEGRITDVSASVNIKQLFFLLRLRSPS